MDKILSARAWGLSTGWIIKFLIFGVCLNPGDALAESWGAEENPTGNPIGGGPGYSLMVPGHDYLVSNISELQTALENAQPGEIIYVEDDAVIDMTDVAFLDIPEGIILASGRGREGSEGALIYWTEAVDIDYQLWVEHPDVRITGLRIQGADTEIGTYDELKNGVGIRVHGAGFELDNCEISGCSTSAVLLMSGSSNAYIHHNYFHHNRMSGLGYGVQLREADMTLVEANLFDANRHHIAATGRQPESYEARYNIVLEEGNSHSFDMHGRPDYSAGDYVHVHHNTFYNMDQYAICIRGIPTQKVEAHHNRFYRNGLEEVGCNSAFLVSGYWDYDGVYAPYKVYIFNNVYGENAEIDPGTGGEAFNGVQELPFLSAPWQDETNPKLTVINGTGTSRYPVNTKVYAVADEPPDKEYFVGWEGDIDSVDDPNAQTITVTMPPNSITITATYRGELPTCDSIGGYCCADGWECPEDVLSTTTTCEGVCCTAPCEDETGSEDEIDGGLDSGLDGSASDDATSKTSSGCNCSTSDQGSGLPCWLVFFVFATLFYFRIKPF